MELGLGDMFIIAGFALWFLFPIGLFISSHRLYDDTDQSEQFFKNFSAVIGKADVWEGKHDEWEKGYEEPNLLPYEGQRSLR